MIGLLALLSAGLWGIGDFSGGMGVKAAGGGTGAALRVVLFSHLTSVGVLLLLGLAGGTPFPHGRLLVWGLVAGLAAGLSLSAFYTALSRGAMGVSAVVSGVLAAAIPALFSMVVDGAPGWRRGVGFFVAGAAIWLIAKGNGKEGWGTLGLAVGAGAGFGIYFVALKYAGAGGVVWAMATARLGSIATCALILLGLRAGSGRVSWRMMRWVVTTAVFDTSGNLLFVAATQAGRLDVAAVLASLYPASTILLAALILKEKLTRRQGFGMAVAVVAVVLITV